MTKELDRFTKIEPRTADEADAPDPFLPPPEKKAPIILDLSDQEHRAAQQAAREKKAELALEEVRRERLQREAERQVVTADEDHSLRLWYATAALPPAVRLGIMGGALGLIAILALAATPVFWIFAPIVVAWFGTTFLARRL